jgi:hypothetical protein
MKTDELLVYWRVIVLVLWGLAGLPAVVNVQRLYGFGVALLLFGIYVVLIWIALK